ncbi:beta strand repeat-containing protein, partial [Thermodesulfobacteriota bacterium]
MSRKTILFLCLVLVVPFINLYTYANPKGPQVTHGQADFSNTHPDTLNVTNSPNAIINWQAFSIQQNEITRFIQESANSAVLNRVIGSNPSHILGQLLSNGHVFLINPNGMVFGPDSVIDTAGFVASTLNITDQDFLEGNFHFDGGPDSGSILNQGFITAGKNGDIYLIAPNIENRGIIHTEGGNLLLAAGESITITSLDTKGVHFEIQARENKVLNLGKILAYGGAVGVFASTLKHEGEIRVDSISIDETGAIILSASNDITLEAGSTVTANGKQGGNVSIESEKSTTLVSGIVEATGSEGKGGEIHLLGERVGLIDSALVDASGESGGGEILIGGDYQGKNPDIRNASGTYIGPDIIINANADEVGNGGMVIIWSDDATRLYGSINARGGEQNGDGGFVETSGGYLDISHASVDTTAVNGDVGTWLLDPWNIEINDGGSTQNVGSAPNYQSTDTLAYIDIDDLRTALASNNVSITTGYVAGAEDGDITLTTDFDFNGIGAMVRTLTLNAHDDIILDGQIYDSVAGLETLNLSLNANSDAGGSVASGDGTVNIYNNIMTVGGTIDATGGSGIVNFMGSPNIDAISFDANTLNISTGTVTLNATSSVEILNLSGGMLQGAGDLTVAGLTTVSGTVTIAGGLGSTLFADGGLNFILDGDTVTLDTQNIIHRGNGTWQVLNTYSTIEVIGSSSIENQGVLDVQGNALFEVNADFVNAAGASLTRSSGNNAISFLGSLDNDGVFIADSGRIEMTGDSSHSGSLSTNRADNGRIIFQGSGTHNLNGASVTGDWLVRVQDSATLNINGAGYDLGTSGGVTQVRGSGVLNVNSDATTGSLIVMDSGVLTGSGDFTVTGDAGGFASLWSGGSLEGSGHLIFDGSNLNIANTAPITLDRTIDLDSLGQWLDTASADILGTGTINIFAGAEFDLQTDFANAAVVPTIYVQPGGTLHKSGITSLQWVTVPSNHGTIVVEAGTLRLAGPATHAGAQLQAAGASPSGFLFVGLHTFDASTSLSGVGYNIFGTGTFTVNGTYNVSGVTSANNPSSIVNFNNSATFGGLSPGFGGILNLNGATYSANTVNMANGGTISVASNLSVANEFFLAQGNLTGTGVVNNPGTLTFTGAGATVVDVAINNTGVVDVQGGTLNFTGINGFTQTAGTTQLNGGNISSSYPMTFNGGTLTGSGTITGDVDVTAATIASGSSPGTLTIDGDLTLTSTSVIDIELGGTNQGVDYDWIDITGTASLDGALNISYFAPYTGNIGDLFQVITASSVTGTFSNVNEPFGSSFTTLYNAGDVTLELISFYPLNEWLNDASGDWGLGSNWSLTHTPQSGEAILIDRGAFFDPTISLTSGTYTVAQVKCLEDFTITGGQLTITGTSDIENLSVSGGTLNFNGASTIDTLTLTTGSLNITDTMTINNTLNWTNTATISGGGTGVLNLPGTTTVSGNFGGTDNR